MKVAVIADSHLGGPGGDGERMLEQLRGLPEAGCRHLVLLGDIFHVWVGSKKFETPEVRRIVPVLRELRRGGMRIDYVEGNRDFFIADSPYADAFDHVGFETRFEAGGKRYLAVHGDGLNRNDRQYLFWRWLSKSPPIRFLILNLPGWLARRLVDAAEQRLAKTNWKFRKRVPEEEIRRYAEERFAAEGWDVLLLGHFHRPCHWAVEGGDVEVLDAWFNSDRAETYGDGAADGPATPA
ncbi:MAG: UDP-2,3-diacylglucosamine diphosphatase [Acidobacteriota bacterium]